MLIEKEKIRRIIQDHKITSFRENDEDELVNIFYEAFAESGKEQENKLATKEDIKMLMQMMDKRFEDMQESMDKRFEAVNKRFEAMDKRFEDLYRYMDKRFEAVDKRFETVDKRFEAVDKRFEDMNKRFTMMFTFMNIGFGIIILLTVLFKFVQ